MSSSSTTAASGESDDKYADVQSVITDISTWFLVVGIIGAFITIVTFVIFPAIRTYPIKLILYLCACLVIGYTAFQIADQDLIVENEGACITVAILTHFFLVADFLWTFCIAFNFYQMIVKRNREVQKLEKFYHLFAWSIPSVIIIIVGSLQYYGAGESETCFIQNDWAQFFSFFLPGLIVLSGNTILFFLIGREIAETLSGAPKTDQRDRKQEFRVYMSIFIALGMSWVFGYIYVLVPQDELRLIFFVIFSIATPLQGLLIFIFYCINSKVGIKWTGLLGKCIPCCRMLNEYVKKSTSSTASRSNSSRATSSASSRG